MPSRRALIVDRDKNFTRRLCRCLGLLEFTVDVAASRREALEFLQADGATIVFIAVERPKKSGFTLFTDVKRLVRNVPIVLTSSTVPMAELMMHQKLRLHADTYLDKRRLTDREILDTLNELLQLKFDSTELSQLAEQSPSGHIDEDAPRGQLEKPQDVLDPALVDLLGDVDVSPVGVESDGVDVVDVSEEEDDDLEDPDEETASLQEEVQSNGPIPQNEPAPVCSESSVPAPDRSKPFGPSCCRSQVDCYMPSACETSRSTRSVTWKRASTRWRASGFWPENASTI